MDVSTHHEQKGANWHLFLVNPPTDSLQGRTGSAPTSSKIDLDQLSTSKTLDRDTNHCRKTAKCLPAWQKVQCHMPKRLLHVDRTNRIVELQETCSLEIPSSCDMFVFDKIITTNNHTQSFASVVVSRIAWPCQNPAVSHVHSCQLRFVRA